MLVEGLHSVRSNVFYRAQHRSTSMDLYETETFFMISRLHLLTKNGGYILYVNEKAFL